MARSAPLGIEAIYLGVPVNPGELGNRQASICLCIAAINCHFGGRG